MNKAKKRDKIIKIRVSKDEKDVIFQMAKMTNLSISAYIRAVLKGKISLKN